MSHFAVLVVGEDIAKQLQLTIVDCHI